MINELIKKELDIFVNLDHKESLFLYYHSKLMNNKQV
jgi:hypothetical protein